MEESYINRLFNHVWWADSEAGKALSAMSTAPIELVELYGHILGAELIWLDRMEGIERSVSVWPDEGLQGCIELAVRSAERYRSFISGLAQADMERIIRYTNSAGKEYSSRLEDILIHVALHGSYHRGQIARGIRSRGGIPNPTDYIGFVRGAPSATRADSD